jgi:Flp pilus assembly protein TadG
MELDCNLQKRATWIARARKRVTRLRGEEGSAWLEFAITLPLLMTVLTGMASFAMAFYSLQQLGNATSGAVQQVAEDQGLITDPCATALTSVTGALSGWTAGNFSYTMVITDSTGTTHTYSSTTSGSSTSFTCTAGAAEEAPNEPVTLTVTYKYTWMPIMAFSPKSNLSTTQAAIGDIGN